MKSETMWAIVGTHGLHTGVELTRKQAMVRHVRAIYGDHIRHGSPEYKRVWRRCRKRGNRPVKVIVSWDK